MTVPSITIKSWTGDPSERFTHEDMARIEANLNTMATFYGVPTQSFTTPTRAGQLLAADAQKIEDTIRVISEMMGWSLPTVSDWASGRGVSFRDFERWESNLDYLHDNGGIIETDGKHTVLVTSSATLPSTTEWEIRNPSNVVEASGVGFSGNHAYRVSDGSDTMILKAYGVTGSNSLTVTTDQVVDMVDFVCQMTVASSVSLSTIMFNGYTFSASGTSTTITVPRSSSSYAVAVSPSTSSPRYSGLSSTALWTWQNTSSSASPNAATKTVTISPTKQGNEIWLTSNGSLGIPVGTYDVWMVGGGGGGYSGTMHPTSYYESSFTNYAGQGGYGGEIKHASKSVASAGNLSVSIGSGGSRGGGSGGTTSVSGAFSMSASGSYGAGGGGVRYQTEYIIKNNQVYTMGHYDTGPGNASRCQFCGGGGASGAVQENNQFYRTGTTSSNGGSGGSYGGAGGSSGLAGSNGTIINGKGYGGAGTHYSSTSSGGAGGGGGYGADGGAGQSGNMYCGGGGGGALGGTGGNGDGYGGRGYGAGGGGGRAGRYYTSSNYYFTIAGGGGGGGLGTVKLSENAPSGTNQGGAGAPGAVLIKWISRASSVRPYKS